MCNSKCKGGCCSTMHVAKILLLVGGINWGLVGLGMLVGSVESWNVVNMVLGSMPVVEGIVYLLVGVAAVMKLFGCRCGVCKGGMCKVEGGDMPTGN